MLRRGSALPNQAQTAIHCSIEANDAGGMLAFLQVTKGVNVSSPRANWMSARKLAIPEPFQISSPALKKVLSLKSPS